MPRSSNTPLHILLINDEVTSQLADILQSQRHRLTIAANTPEAVVCLKREAFDLLIAPIKQIDLSVLIQASNCQGVSLWLAGDHQTLTQTTDQIEAIDEFIQYPVIKPVLLRRLTLFQERCDFQHRQICLENLLREQASLDSLTRLPNRHFAIQHLQLLWQLFRRKHTPFCTILCDLDDFTKHNTLLGQQVGDKILQTVAHMFKSKMRTSDLVCRYDGQRFLILCDETEEEGSRLLVARLTQYMAGLDLPEDLLLTASFALVASDSHFTSANQILQAAEKALTEAKKQGPAQIISYHPKIM